LVALSGQCRIPRRSGFAIGDGVAQAHELANDGGLLAGASAAVDELPLFGGVLDDEIGQAFRTLIDCLRDDGDPAAMRAAWGRLFALLAAEVELGAAVVVGDAWQNHLLERLLTDENAFSHKAQRAPLDAMGSALADQARRELEVLSRLHALSAGRLHAAVSEVAAADVWPRWDALRPLEADSTTEDVPTIALKRRFAARGDWSALLADLAKHYARAGTGLFGRYRAFRWVRVADQGRL